MKKRLSILFVNLIIWLAFYSHQALSDLVDQYLLNVPVYTKSLVKTDSELASVHIQSKKATANYPEHVLFSGNVNIYQDNSIITADEIQLIQHKTQNKKSFCTITATGNVNYSNNEIKLKGEKAWSNLNTKDTDIYQGKYQIANRQGRGDADAIKQRNNKRYTVLENGSFTSCLLEDNSWSIVGEEVIHDREEQITEIWNAFFKIGKLPVLYSPYLKIPFGNNRRSRFLIPYTKYGSNNGFELSLPFCLNIIQNYDVTITPKYISKRGTQIQTEFRYQTKSGKRLIELDWLPKKRIYRNEHISSNDNNNDRWLFYWHDNEIIDKVWRFNVDYTKVNNSTYFNNLDSKYGSTTDNYNTQKFSFGYADENCDTALSYKKFQVFNTNKNNSYRAIPQFDITYYKNDIAPFNFEIFSQATKFTNVNNSYPEGTRFHIEPKLNLLLSNNWGSLNTEAKLMATYYRQKNIDEYKKNINIDHQLKSSVIRILPQLKTNGRMIFERNMDFIQNYKQTLEPSLQYLYVPYRNQNNIGIYDAILLQEDYLTLFRDRTYSGLDRIPSANQLSGYITTRIYDDNRVERFNASLGQIYYFFQPRISDTISNYNKYDNTGSLVWTYDNYWYISNQWGVRSGLRYDSRLNNVTLGNAVLEYLGDKKHIIQLNYRYISPKYLEKMLTNINHSFYQKGISQIGVTYSWPLIDYCSLVGAYYYDTKSNQSANQVLGLQYSTCCWAINVGYERKITGFNKANNYKQYDNKVSFNIELRGLNGDSNLDIKKILTSSIIPYQRAF
ncbi:LPS assembly protein LptD [Candidatus Gullanella endobia]|nr:LPS assembly protein LptD [Candidatus Gullanella endobia]